MASSSRNTGFQPVRPTGFQPVATGGFKPLVQIQLARNLSQTHRPPPTSQATLP